MSFSSLPFERLDYLVMALYVLGMGALFIAVRRRRLDDLDDYFAGGKNLPWWLVGISMVATTFAADTPLAVTGILASDGLAGNWIWWNFMFSGVFTVFLYARLWKRADVITDVEFISIRYSGKPARFLRGFRAVYLALPINCIILGWVTVGMAKVMSVVTGAEQWMIILLLYLVIGVYIALAGLWGVVLTDFFQFFIAMGGSILLAWYAVDAMGGLDALLTGLQGLPGGADQVLSINPLTSPSIAVSTALVWVAMMWWASWYPGSEPGGGGYVAQRMFSAKNERHAVGGTLFFNVMHYCVRPWPWILVGLASLVLLPGLDDPETGYPILMVRLLPAGLLGLLAVAFLSAFVSTVSTHLNWGSSYLVNDVYRAFVRKPDSFASPEQAQRHYILVSRLATLLIMAVSILVSYFFDTVKEGWEAILSIGAGTGLVYMLRWYWWRVNAWSEIAAMSAAFVASLSAPFIGFGEFASRMMFTTVVATIVWLVVTYRTRPVDAQVLAEFVRRVRPGGPGWREVEREMGLVSAESGAGAGDSILASTLPPPMRIGRGLVQVAVSVAAILLILISGKHLLFGEPWLGIALAGGGVGLLALVVRDI